MSNFNARQGISVGPNAVNVIDATGNITATSFTGSGAGLTRIPVTALVTTGSGSASTYLNGAGAYTTPSMTLPSSASFNTLDVSGTMSSSSFYTNGLGTIHVVGSGGIGGNLLGSSRASGGTYTNSTSRILAVYISATNSSNGYIIVTIGGVVMGKLNCYKHPTYQCILIPPGYSYNFTNSGATLDGWYEY